jgi:hypothetical protein
MAERTYLHMYPHKSLPRGPPALDDGWTNSASGPVDLTYPPNPQVCEDSGEIGPLEGPLVSCGSQRHSVRTDPGYAVLSGVSFHPFFGLHEPDDFPLVHPGMRTLLVCLGNMI